MASSDAFYLGLVAEVNPILQEYGTVFTIKTPGAFDTDSMETGPATERECVGIVADQEFTSGIMQMAGGGFTSWKGSKNLLLQNTLNPQVGESVVVDGKEYPVSKIEPIKPADVVIVYILDLTR